MILNVNELELINNCYKHHTDCYKKYKKTEKMTITVTQTGIGRHIILKCLSCEKEEDCSDYGHW